VTDHNSSDLEDMEILLLTVKELLDALSSQKNPTTSAVASISLGCTALTGTISPFSEDWSGRPVKIHLNADRRI
jgi:hypothetical protein